MIWGLKCKAYDAYTHTSWMASLTHISMSADADHVIDHIATMQAWARMMKGFLQQNQDVTCDVQWVVIYNQNQNEYQYIGSDLTPSKLLLEYVEPKIFLTSIEKLVKKYEESNEQE